MQYFSWITVLAVCVIHMILVSSWTELLSNMKTGKALTASLLVSGSFAYRTTYSVAYNLAAVEGNVDVYQGLRRYNNFRSDTCSDERHSSSDKQQNAQKYIDTVLYNYAQSQAQVEILRGCLNTTVLDTSYRLGCCQYTGD